MSGSDAPSLTKSMHIVLRDLRLEHLFVVYPGKESCALDTRVDVISIQELPEKLASRS